MLVICFIRIFELEYLHVQNNVGKMCSVQEIESFEQSLLLHPYTLMVICPRQSVESVAFLLFLGTCSITAGQAKVMDCVFQKHSLALREAWKHDVIMR